MQSCVMSFDSNQNRKSCLNSPAVVFIGLVASLFTIITFTTGIPSLSEFLEFLNGEEPDRNNSIAIVTPTTTDILRETEFYVPTITSPVPTLVPPSSDVIEMPPNYRLLFNNFDGIYVMNSIVVIYYLHNEKCRIN